MLTYFVIFLTFSYNAVARHVNKTEIDKYRMDFMLQMLNNTPFHRIAPVRMQNSIELDDKWDKDVVLYYLFRRDAPYTAVRINDNITMVDPSLMVKMFVHGWTEHYYVEWCKNLTSAYFSKGDYNIVILDWSSKGDNNYISASLAIKPLGDIIAEFILTRLNQEAQIPMENIHLISHSLGCHLAGMIGQSVNKMSDKKLGRITALDPAKPYFDIYALKNDDRLSEDDADFVDIIHTDSGWLGFKQSIGTADFYPNGGKAYQPGCSLLRLDVKYEDLFCSHAVSHVYYQKSVLFNIPAMHCDSWDQYANKQCNGNSTIYFGDPAPTNISGTYFLTITK